MTESLTKKRVLITGGSGFLGQAIAAQLKDSSYNVVTTSRLQHDLTSLDDCLQATQHIDTIIHLAGLVLSRGEQQKRPAEVFTTNTRIMLNVADAAKQNGVRRIIFISSVTAYPTNTPAPFGEATLWDGPVNEAGYAYGVAKRITETVGRTYAEQYGIETCVLFLPNLYGPNDKFNNTPPPLIPNLITQIHQAVRSNQLQIVGGQNGAVELDLLYVTDAADAVIAALRAEVLPHTLNIGGKTTVSIKAAHEQIAAALAYQGTITWEDSPTPPPSPRLMDIAKAEEYLGWQSTTDFATGIKLTVENYLNLVSLSK